MYENLWYSTNAKALGLLQTLHRPTLVDKAAAKGQERRLKRYRDISQTRMEQRNVTSIWNQ